MSIPAIKFVKPRWKLWGGRKTPSPDLANSSYELNYGSCCFHEFRPKNLYIYRSVLILVVSYLQTNEVLCLL